MQKLKEFAMILLRGVGDSALGEWEEKGDVAFHLRRRVSDKERELANGLEVVDVRRTPEYGVRRSAMQRFLPSQYANWQEN